MLTSHMNWFIIKITDVGKVTIFKTWQYLLLSLSAQVFAHFSFLFRANIENIWTFGRGVSWYFLIFAVFKYFFIRTIFPICVSHEDMYTRMVLSENWNYTRKWFSVKTLKFYQVLPWLPCRYLPIQNDFFIGQSLSNWNSASSHIFSSFFNVLLNNYTQCFSLIALRKVSFKIKALGKIFFLIDLFFSTPK